MTLLQCVPKNIKCISLSGGFGFYQQSRGIWKQTGFFMELQAVVMYVCKVIKHLHNFKFILLTALVL